MATKAKAKEKSIVSKEELKEVVIKQPEILEQKTGQVGTSGGMPATYTKKRLNSGAILETFGEG